MTFLFYFGHPAQYLAMRETIRCLSEKKNNRVIVLIKSKDILEELIRTDGIPYTNILPKQRGKTRLSIVLSLLKRIAVMLPIFWREKPDLLIGTDAALAQLGRLLGVDCVTIIEDDYAVIENLAQLTYPFTQTILCPAVCDVGNWQAKKVGYPGYMKLGYLHPAVFSADGTVLKKYSLAKNYVLVRLSKLAAHHDTGIRGISEALLDEIIEEVTQRRGYSLWITSEGQIDQKYQAYKLQINPADLHHVLAGAVMLISDSQSMSVEAAILGVPSIRYSDFVGKISVLNELEDTYHLTVGIAIQDSHRLLPTMNNILDIDNLSNVFLTRKQVMLNDKINVTPFFVWFFENYPTSKQAIKEGKAFA